MKNAQVPMRPAPRETRDSLTEREAYMFAILIFIVVAVSPILFGIIKIFNGINK